MYFEITLFTKKGNAHEANNCNALLLLPYGHSLLNSRARRRKIENKRMPFPVNLLQHR
jgi:hypothetical protein